MKKKYSIGKFVIIAVLCAIVTVLTVFGFSLSGKSQDNDFKGFARAVNLGVEYIGGTVKEYSIKSNSTQNKNLAEGISSSATRIEYLLERDKENYDTNVYQNGENLVIEFLDDYSPYDIQSIINKKVEFGLKTSQDATAENVVGAEDVETAYATQSGTNNIVYVIFTESGAQKFQTQVSSNTLYLYIDGNYIYSISNDSVMSYQYIVFGANASTLPMERARYYASQVLSSKYDLEFTEVSSKTYTEAEASKNAIVLICLVVGLFILCASILLVMFKKLGLVGAFTLFIGLLLQIMLLQAIPETVFTLTSAGMFASLFCMVFGALSIYMFYDKMHKEYQLGKVLYASIKFGYNKIWARILDTYLVLLVPAIVTFFFGSYFVKQFALALIAGLFVYGVVTIVLTKFFTRWLTYISTKNKDYGFKREAHVDELK